MMANPLWRKGVSGNPAGRPNKTKQTIQRRVEMFVNKVFTEKEMKRIYKGLDDRERLMLYLALLPYYKPKEAGQSGFPPGIPFNQLNVQIIEANHKENGHTEFTDNDCLPIPAAK